MSAKENRFFVAAATSLVVILALQMWLSIRHLSQTFDESAHIYSGLEYWQHGDFGVNPEHPPLVKLLATLPLLNLGLKPPAPLDMFFRYVSAAGGIQFLYSNDAEKLLFRSRVAASFLTLLLAILIFAAAREMFGPEAGLLALLIFVFDPNILANGALVTTDIGATCGIFAAVYFFYRYAKQRTVPRLIVSGVVTGLALATKHSVLFLFPLFVVLALTEIFLRSAVPAADSPAKPSVSNQSLRWAGSVAVICVVSIVVLWSFYGFRYKARPGNSTISPPLAAYVQGLSHPWQRQATLALSHSHLLPEAYVFGFSDIEVISEQGRPTFVLGKLYPTGQWFYFPAAFLIKSTLGFLLLLFLLIFAKNLRSLEKRREVLYLALPALLYFSVTIDSHLDIGFRHLLPIFPFLIVLIGGGAWSFQQSRKWGYVVAVLLIIHIASSVHAYPYYLSYSNEAWGGPKNTYKFLSDSNAGWGSGLKAVHQYIADHHVTNCWFAYSSIVPFPYYQVPCRVLPTYMSENNGTETGPIPASVDGTIFLDEAERAGFWWGPGTLNPYQQFVSLPPDDVIAGETLVYHGHFDVPAAAAVSHLHTAEIFLRMGKVEQAMPELQTAMAMDPNAMMPHIDYAIMLAQMQRKDDAKAELQKAMAIAHPHYPEFQEPELKFFILPSIQGMLH
jgi:tetratricopeptide (TPR) repeat protein